MLGGHSEDKTGRDFKTFVQSECAVLQVGCVSVVED